MSSHTGADLSTSRDVAALALRLNPKRAHLLVSSILGKHVPVPAGSVLTAAADLGALARAALDVSAALDPFVVGFAETATALGHGVARVCAPGGGQAPYAHTTRRPVPAGAPVLAFEEEHSHATEQVLAVTDDRPLRERRRPVVLVDDELSSGRTAVNAVRALHQRWPRERYLLASLLDVRSSAQRAANRAEVAELGAELLSVAVVDGQVQLPADLALTAAALVGGRDTPPPPVRAQVPVTSWQLATAAPLTGAFGWDASSELALQSAVDLLAARLQLTGTTLVLGDEEFMYAGQLLAQALGPQVCTSSTTRSPALVVDEPGYPLRTALRFGATDDAARAAFAYNVLPSAHADRGPAPGFDHIVLLLDRPVPAHTRAGLIDQLAQAATSSVQVVVVAHAAAPTVSRLP